MSSDLHDELLSVTGSLGLFAKSKVQLLFDQHRKFLSNKKVENVLETVELLDENFPYWIKLEYRNPISGTWTGAQSATVLPEMIAGGFDDAEYRYDETRARALLDLPTLIRNPNCIHRNLRHAERGHGGIQGRHVYVEYYSGNSRKVGFTTLNPHRCSIILVSSFWTNAKWVSLCAQGPALYVRPGAQCRCCKGIEKPPTRDGSSMPLTPGPE